MTLLVTGANGFVGASLCREALRRGIGLRAAARVPLAAELAPVQIGVIDGDTDWSTALQGVDTVIHLAAVAHRPLDAAGLATLQAVNVDGVLRLARQASVSGVRRVVFLSSIKAWGEATLPGQLARETDTCHPQDAYGRSKAQAEQGLLAMANGLEIVIVRAPLVYGPQARGNFATLARAVQSGWPLPLASVRNARSLVGLDNLVDFLLLCAQHPDAIGQTFHVSDGADLSSAELVRAVAQAAGRPARLFPLPPALLRAALMLLGKGAAADRLLGNLQLDIAKARALLGWQPVLPVADGMQRALGKGAPC